ncbi:hypothetical protein RND71_042408 [Anisodus tanguticus]|uniref:Uncharacterized protein n=1 Tax=Anisodus tanguticus TaxID=243964 RepID=A0AAE1QRD6_9SOLA|nr:hypothetical protein RND71_042408 [Anisodus tanguticus]
MSHPSDDDIIAKRILSGVELTGQKGKGSLEEVLKNKDKQPVVSSSMKWKDEMVKILITANSYIDEDVWFNGIFPKKSKCRAISNDMAERCHRVSPTLIGRVLADDIYMGPRCIATRNQE